MKNILTGIAFCALQATAFGQDINIGIHANPILAAPVLNGKSKLQEDLKPYWLSVGYNVGANLHLKFEKMSVEFAPGYVRKSVTVTQKTEQLGFDSYYRISIPSTAIELPVLVNLLLHRHDKDKVYDLYFVAGAAYEMGMIKPYSGSTTSGSGGLNLYVEGRYNGVRNYSTVTPVIGFKINAVLKSVGLIDYGFSFHFPVQATGPYITESKYNRGSGTNLYTNSIYAHTSYIDIKLCYYLLSFDKTFKRLKYRVN